MSCITLFSLISCRIPQIPLFKGIICYWSLLQQKAYPNTHTLKEKLKIRASWKTTISFCKTAWNFTIWTCSVPSERKRGEIMPPANVYNLHLRCTRANLKSLAGLPTAAFWTSSACHLVVLTPTLWIQLLLMPPITLFHFIQKINYFLPQKQDHAMLEFGLWSPTSQVRGWMTWLCLEKTPEEMKRKADYSLVDEDTIWH